MYLDSLLIGIGYRRASGPPELEKLLAGFAYKPGWQFTVARPGPTPAVPVAAPWDPPMLVILLEDVEDSREPGKHGMFVHQATVPDYGGQMLDTREFWLDWLRRQVWAAEQHEMDEWFVVDGVRPFDPHRPRR